MREVHFGALRLACPESPRNGLEADNREATRWTQTGNRPPMPDRLLGPTAFGIYLGCLKTLPRTDLRRIFGTYPSGGWSDTIRARQIGKEQP